MGASIVERRQFLAKVLGGLAGLAVVPFLAIRAEARCGRLVRCCPAPCLPPCPVPYCAPPPFEVVPTQTLAPVAPSSRPQEPGLTPSASEVPPKKPSPPPKREQDKP